MINKFPYYVKQFELGGLNEGLFVIAIMLVIVAGPAGCGKSTVGALLSEKMNVPFIDGDDLHPKSNIEKMSNGIPLTDEDRWGWLEIIARTGSKIAEDTEEHICIAACSALKLAYRKFLRDKASVNVAFVYIPGTIEELSERVNKRKGHFMHSSMVKSQVDIMEVPNESEPHTLVYWNWVPIDECVKKLYELQKILQ